LLGISAAEVFPSSTGIIGVPLPVNKIVSRLPDLAAGTQNAMQVIRRAIGLMSERREKLAESPAQSALKLAIWSQKGRIDAEEVKRLGPLWMKYFQE
jgi:N-acetylglutamate synthase/N-acetylornithine aminotransferase